MIIQFLTSLLSLLPISAAFAIVSPQTPWQNIHTPILPRQSNNTNTTLASQQLAAGIGFNIMAQQGEVAVTTAIQNLQQQPAFTFEQFNASKVLISPRRKPYLADFIPRRIC